MAPEKVDIDPDLAYAHLSARELIATNLKCIREEVIPLASVLTEEAIIDQSHADELALNMKEGGFGQITPIGVRARIDEITDSIVYDIFDGFHRTDGKKRSGEIDIRASVAYGCSDEELFDLRILAASSVRTVQFARIAEWITKAYSFTPWARTGLTVAQAFSIATSDSKTSYNANLAREEITELKGWANEKCKKWGKPITSTLAVLRIIEDADPELVKQVRSSSGPKGHKVVITQDRLAAVVGVFPVQTHRKAQRAVLQFVVEKRLYAEQVPVFARRISHVITPDMEEEEIITLLRNINDQDLIKLCQTDIDEGFSQVTDEEDFSCEMEDKDFVESIPENGHNPEAMSPDDLLVIDEAEPETPKNQVKERRALFSGGKDPNHLERTSAFDGTQLKVLIEENHSLRVALKAAQGGKEIINLELLINSAILPEAEGEVMRKLFIEHKELSEACLEMEMPVGRLILLLQSAFHRYSLHEKILKPEEVSYIETAENDKSTLW